jgi:hypothetical protein
MKKFFLLLNKEIKEILTPQMWVPFLTVIVILFVVGNIASKQVKQQSNSKESIAVFDADQSGGVHGAVFVADDGAFA